MTRPNATSRVGRGIVDRIRQQMVEVHQHGREHDQPRPFPVWPEEEQRDRAGDGGVKPQVQQRHPRHGLSLLQVVVALAAAAVANAQEPPRSTVLPLSDATNWQVLQYSRLPPHRIRFANTGLEIAVDGSAMPLIYALPTRLRVSGIRVKGRVEGALRLPAERQGEEKFDDYVFRIGLVEPGTRTLNVVQRQLAADWVRKLFELAPKGSGISGIQFFNVGADKAHIGRHRRHPLSDLIAETVVAVPRPDGRFDFAHSLVRPLDTIAVWLSSDGDDTGSRFAVLIEHIELH